MFYLNLDQFPMKDHVDGKVPEVISLGFHDDFQRVVSFGHAEPLHGRAVA